MSHEADPVTDEARHAAVMAALDTVLDPELDEPLTDLRFIHEVVVEGDCVRVTLRLPTYWCSANFAYIMGEDIKAAVGALPFVQDARVTLVDHFAVRRVNDGLAAGLSFREAFEKEADADLGDVRADFRDKGFLGRQATLIQSLRREKQTPDDITAMTIDALNAWAVAGGPEREKQVARYLERRNERAALPGGNEHAFLTVDGAPIGPDNLLNHLREARRIRGSFEANAQMCSILLDARYGAHAAPEDPVLAQRTLETTHDECD